jgi:signal transduction histidine kinase
MFSTIIVLEEGFVTTALVDRLGTYRTLAGVPRGQLQWLASHGDIYSYAVGGIVARKGEPIEHLLVVLSGHISISINLGAGRRKVAEWREGDVTGNLPYSRMAVSPGDTVAERPTEVLRIHRSHFVEMIRECDELTSVLVHVMLDRARYFRATELQDEKLLSLGKLSARLAHELNNPASAVDRTAKSLMSCLTELDDAGRALGDACLPAEQLAAVDRVRRAEVASGGRPAALTPLERVEREDAIGDWLAGHHVASVEADALTDAAISLASLEELGDVLDGSVLPVAVKYLAALSEARRLASEIGTAAARIHALVSAVKGFTYMDQAAVPKPVDIGRGLSDTITVLRAKARTKNVDLRLEVEPGLPLLEGFGGELNQAWSNLIDNALDAVSQAGHVTVTAASAHGSIVVRVIDDGPGIPDEIRDRIFEPFFTTKRVGEGTGLGLDTVRRVIDHHEGALDVSSGPGGTEFRVTLPISAAERQESA